MFGKWSWDLRVNWLIDFHFWLLFILIKEIIPQFSSQKMRVIVKQKIFRNMLPLIWFIFNERYNNVLPEDSIGFVIFFVPARKEINTITITITPLWTGVSTRAIAQMLGKSSSEFKSLRNATNYYYEGIRWRLTLRKQSLQNIIPSRTEKIKDYPKTS